MDGSGELSELIGARSAHRERFARVDGLVDACRVLRRPSSEIPTIRAAKCGRRGSARRMIRPASDRSPAEIAARTATEQRKSACAVGEAALAMSASQASLARQFVEREIE